MDYSTYRKIRAYCWLDVGVYIEREVALERSMARYGKNFKRQVTLEIAMARYERERDMAMKLYRSVALTLSPREIAAARLLGVISNHVAITWPLKLRQPDGQEPPPPLENGQLDELKTQTRKALGEYVIFLPDREAAALIAAYEAAPAIVEKVQHAIQAETKDTQADRTLDSDDWKVMGRKIGVSIFAEKSHLNMDQIAEKTNQEMNKRNIKGEPGMTGRGGRVPSPATIKRHALTGIKS